METIASVSIVHPSARTVNRGNHLGSGCLESQVVAYIHREQLVLPGDRVVIGVSGGPDSLCLLHVLWLSMDRLGIELHVAHLNHMIRGADADLDARFVADQAAERGLAHTVAARDVPAAAQRLGLAIEEAARRVRYAFLAQVACEVGAARIAVAHNADDQSETVLMHWLRGAGLAGLRGMLPAVPIRDLRLLEGLESAGDIWLIRPLLSTRRTTIEGYCQEHELRPRFDRSNLDTTYFRNSLRHELLPLLEREYKPRFREILRRSARVIRDDYDLLCELRDRAWQEIVRQASDRAVVLDRSGWAALHPSLQRATLRHAVQQLRQSLRDVNFEHVEAAVQVAREKGTGAQATLPRGVMLTVGYQTLVIADADHVPTPDFPTLAGRRTVLAVPGQTFLPGGARVDIDIVPRSQLPAGWAENPNPWLAYLDADAVGTNLSLRRRQRGDRFCPLGLDGRHKLVSELMVNDKVPAWWRDLIPLLVRQDDHIMWVCGWRVDDRAKVTDRTSQVAVVRLHHPDKSVSG